MASGVPTDALERSTTTIYDANGRLIARIDPLWHRTSLAYDLAGRQVRATDAIADADVRHAFGRLFNDRATSILALKISLRL